MSQFETTSFKIVSSHFRTQHLDFPNPSDGEVVAAPQSDGKGQEWTLQPVIDSEESPRRYYIVNSGTEQTSGTWYLSVVELDGGQLRIVGIAEKLTSWVILDNHGNGEFQILANDNVTGYLAIDKRGGDAELANSPGDRSNWTLTPTTVPLKSGSYPITNVGRAGMSLTAQLSIALQGTLWQIDVQPQGDYTIKLGDQFLGYTIHDSIGIAKPSLRDSAQTWSLKVLGNESYSISVVLESGRQRVEYLLGLDDENKLSLHASPSAPSPAQTWAFSSTSVPAVVPDYAPAFANIPAGAYYIVTPSDHSQGLSQFRPTGVHHYSLDSTREKFTLKYLPGGRFHLFASDGRAVCRETDDDRPQLGLTGNLSEAQIFFLQKKDHYPGAAKNDFVICSEHHEGIRFWCLDSQLTPESDRKLYLGLHDLINTNLVRYLAVWAFVPA